MTFVSAAALCAVTIWILARTGLAERAARIPALLIALGAILSLGYRAVGGPFAASEWVAGGADVLLAGLAFACAAQFRLTRLATVCPASFRLTIGGAPLFLIVCSLAAFILNPQLPLTAAMLVGAALMLNGAAFDRRAVTDAPTPAIIKAAVRLESAAILALGIPAAVLIEAIASAAPQGMPMITPVYEATLALFFGFSLGGSLGLAAAFAGNRMKNKRNSTALACGAGLLAFLFAPLISAHPVIAATAAGLLWGEQTLAPTLTRVRMRRAAERSVAPLAYFAFGVLLAPRIFQADLLALLFAIAAVTIMRAGPRLAALKKTSLAKESQMFLAWFGGAPGAASALFLISLLDAPSIVAQDAVLTVGALAVTLGVAAARLTSRPLVRFFLRESALARRRALYAQ